MKRIMSLFLAVLLLCGLLFSAIPAHAAADEVETVPVHVFDQDDNEVWSGNAPKGELMTAWLDANAAAYIAKEGFTADKWYNKDSGAKFDATATFNGWTNILVKYEEVVQNEEPEDEENETEMVPVHVFDQNGAEIWSGSAPKGNAVNTWLDANVASHVVRDGYLSDKWYNKDANIRFDATATFNGWTNVLVKYQAVQTEEPEDPEEPEEPTAAIYVDVILNSKTSDFASDDYHRCVLENGKIKQSDINAIAEKIKGKNIIGWTCEFGGVTYRTDMLSKYDFSTLQNPINIFPVFKSTTSNKFPYKVYLNIYKDNKVDEPHKTINITDGLALDGKVTLSEVKSLLKSYYTARTSDGIQVDGMYLAKGNWVSNFVNNTKAYTTIEDTNEMRKESEVNINVMITNANTKSTPVNDSPKTGDNIGIFAVTMMVSVIGLSAVLLLNKKAKKLAIRQR